VRSKLRLVPWVLLASGSALLLFAFVLQGLELAGSTHRDAGATVGRIYFVAFAVLGLGMVVWPFLPSFQEAISRYFEQNSIGVREPPHWFRLTVPVLVAGGGLIMMGVAVTSWH
jgi:hypothetical protein